MFLRDGLPYKVVGGVRFYERREIRDELAYLRVLSNPDDTVSLRRILNVPKRGIGDRAEEIVAQYADRERCERDADSFGEDLGVSVASLLAFQRDLEAKGIADRVLTLVWSEFGRRPEENGSQGTDHGAAGTAVLMGSQAKGVMVGQPASMTSLDEDDNLVHNSDYRDVYSSLLEQWFQVDASDVIPQRSGAKRWALVKGVTVP